MHAIREPAVSGVFYESEPARLQRTVRQYLDNARTVLTRRPEALVVPHAGLRYSGPIAAEAYHGILPWAGDIHRIILLGPSHRVALRGMAVPTTQGFRTPLGVVPIDRTTCERLHQECPAVLAHDLPHQYEHCLEVQLPFLQTVLPSFRLVPIVVGETPPEYVVQALELAAPDEETLIIVSSDLSHYHEYDAARVRDLRSARMIESLQPKLTGEDACGCYALNGLLAYARKQGWQAETLMVKNSGDTAGDPSRVVGYGAFAFFRTA